MEQQEDDEQEDIHDFRKILTGWKMGERHYTGYKMVGTKENVPVTAERRGSLPCNRHQRDKSNLLFWIDNSK